jgi:hypothetical protein
MIYNTTSKSKDLACDELLWNEKGAKVTLRLINAPIWRG